LTPYLRVKREFVKAGEIRSREIKVIGKGGDVEKAGD